MNENRTENTQSVSEYHQIFADLKSSDPTASAGVLHQRTMAKIASLRKEEMEDEAKMAELRAIHNQTRLNRLVRGVTGLGLPGGRGGTGGQAQLDGSDRSNDNGASPREQNGTPASTPVVSNGTRQTFIGRPTLLGIPGLNGAVSSGRGLVYGLVRRASQDAPGSSRGAGFDWNAGRDDGGNDHVAYEVHAMPLGGYIPGANGGHRKASGKGNLAPRKSVGDLTMFNNDEASRGDTNSASGMSDISGLFLDETDDGDGSDEEDLRSRSARHHELAQLTLRASRTSKSTTSSGSMSCPPPNGGQGPTPNDGSASALRDMRLLLRDEPKLAARIGRPSMARRRHSATAAAALAEPSLLSPVQSVELGDSSNSRRSRRRHSLARSTNVEHEYETPLLEGPDEGGGGGMHVQIQCCDLESGRVFSSTSGLGLSDTPGSSFSRGGGDPLNRSDHTGYSSYSYLSDITGRSRDGSLHGLIVGFGNRLSARGDDLIVGFGRRRSRAMSDDTHG